MTKLDASLGVVGIRWHLCPDGLTFCLMIGVTISDLKGFKKVVQLRSL